MNRMDKASIWISVAAIVISLASIAITAARMLLR